MRVLVFFFLIISSVFSQSEKLVVSIMDINGEGVSPRILKGCYKKLETSLIQSNRFTVIEKSQREALLDEQAFQASGNCDDACAVEIGQLIGAEYLVIGEILDFGKSGNGNYYQVDIKIVSIEKGDVQEKVTTEVEGKPRELFAAIEQASQDIVRRIASAGITAPIITPGTGIQLAQKVYSDVYVESTPPGATIMIDGVEKGFTPAKVEGIQIGTRKLMLILPGYETLQKGIVVEDGKIGNVSEVLIPKTGGFTILSEPSGAMVYLFDQPKGQTPLNLESLEVKEYVVRVELENYKPKTLRVNVQYNDNITQKFKLDPLPGNVNAIIDPPSAEIFIKGKKYKLSRTGITKIKLNVGTHKLDIKKSGYDSQTRTVTIGPNESVPIEVNLRKKPAGISSDPTIGFLSVKSDLEGVKLKVSRQKMIQTKVPEPLDLPLDYFELKYGLYNLKAFADGYESKKQSVIIKQQETERIEISLDKKSASKAFKFSLYFPGTGQMYAGAHQRGMVYALSTIALGALIGDTFTSLQEDNDLMDEYYDTYKSAIDPNDINMAWDSYNSQVAVVNDTQQQLMIFAGALAGSWLINIVDAYFFTGLR